MTSLHSKNIKNSYFFFQEAASDTVGMLKDATSKENPCETTPPLRNVRAPQFARQCKVKKNSELPRPTPKC